MKYRAGPGSRSSTGPFRARDLPAYLATHTATREMRTVRFTLADRLILAPVELVHIALPALAAAVILFILPGPVAALAAVAAVLAGTVLFPALLPAIPTRDFSTKGFFLGAVVAIPFAASFALAPGMSGIAQVIAVPVPFLLIPAVTAYLALNFTGSTTFTSRTGVKKEIFRYVPGDGADGRCRDDPRDRAGNPPGHGGGLMSDSYAENTLRYFPDRCINCRRCTQVCPHGVFAEGAERAVLVHPRACMECGACAKNCPVQAIEVQSGVGCAWAMIGAALRGKDMDSAECSCGDRRVPAAVARQKMSHVRAGMKKGDVPANVHKTR